MTRRRTLLTSLLVVGALAAGAAAYLFRPDPAGAEIAAEQVDLSPLDRVPAETWQRLAAKRIFFAHKSVGDNIVTGLTDIAARKPGVVPPITLAESSPSDAAGLTHCDNGENHDPASKIAAFSAALDAGPAPDIAVLKFCFLDADAMAAGELFAAYKAAVAALRERHPATTFVHVTMPLSRVQTGAKARVKSALGMEVYGHAPNRARAEYNRLLRAEYGGKEPMFDVARTESTLPDGRRAVFGGGVECMAWGYTPDGGHLSEAGRLAAARDFLLTLAEVVK